MLRTKCHVDVESFWVYLDERVNKGQESKAFVKPEEACSSSFSLHLDQTSNINRTFQTLKKQRTVRQAAPVQGQKQSGQAILSGWGSTSKSIRPVLPNKLQKAVVPILSNEECLKELTSQLTVDQQLELFRTQVCSGTAGREMSAYSGVSCGSLAQGSGAQAVQVGIVSWGMMPSGSSHMPSVYTSVAPYVD
ncbi:trypsin-1-like [Osmia bicornis bicornis]|uniref:trypsin-1-like n=1 Tax=Osmia bicornis bicornis TaxID=1437191 RepID=UPI001EAE9D8A|nr:trypsin-1-like [Osmia bicornis bicornis]